MKFLVNENFRRKWGHFLLEGYRRYAEQKMKKITYWEMKIEYLLNFFAKCSNDEAEQGLFEFLSQRRDSREKIETVALPEYIFERLPNVKKDFEIIKERVNIIEKENPNYIDAEISDYCENKVTIKCLG